ncbi:MAG: phosphoenolpyruvate--protein phosphotransferase [Actinobacteria bacterium]|nr:phosphoenolpyruvate--protein phosphotransferase [Actinomycetota bacterium]
MSERVLVGAGVGSGIAMGPALTLRSDSYIPWDIEGAGSNRGLLAIKEALHDVDQDLAKLEPNAEAIEIIEALRLVLRDPELLASIKEFLADGANTQRAVSGAFREAATSLSKLGEYFSDRASDVLELRTKVIDKLAGRKDAVWPDEPFILVTDNLGPIEISKLADSKIVGLVTSSGSPASHTAILARAIGLPTVVSVLGAELIASGDFLILDSSCGQVFVGPDEIELSQYGQAMEVNLLTKSIRTVAAHELPVKLYANLGSSSEALSARDFGAQGVGLFRTELLFLGAKEAPSFQQQVLEYSRLLAEFPDQVVIVRVLDLDTDKPLPFLKLVEKGKYANRGFQALLANPEVLETQLLALAKAQENYPQAQLWVMAPMITSAQQAKTFIEMAHLVGLSTAGVMIEVPEVCEMSVLEDIVSEVDFLSIGTNDLTQYTLDKDRLTSQLAVIDVRKPEVMKLIERVISSANSHGKPVGICGEAAGDPESAQKFIDFGVSSLSVSPALLPGLVEQLT